MKRQNYIFLLTSILFQVGLETFAWDFRIQNDEGIMLYYNYINDGKELELTYDTYYGESEYYSNKLETIKIPSEVVYMNRTRKVTRIGKNAFWHVTCLNKVILPETIKAIDDYAFYECDQLKELILPNSLETIGNKVFSHCHINSLFIGENMKSLGDHASGASLIVDTIYVKDMKSFLNIDYKNINFFNTYGEALLYDSSGSLISNLIIPEGVTKIGRSLRGCKSIKTVTIPETITEIDDYAFYGCINLTEVNMHDNIKTIGEEAFCGCNISEIKFPKNLTSIKSGAFGGCKFKSIDLPNSLVCAYGFRSCESLAEITLPEKIEKFNFEFCDNLLTVVSKIINPKETPCGYTWTSGYNSGFSNAFSRNTLMNATLYVPIGTKEKYMEAEGWKDFVFIEEMSPTGILPIGESNKTFEIKRYTINGRQISQPQKGINIIKMSDGTSKKIYVK